MRALLGGIVTTPSGRRATLVLTLILAVVATGVLLVRHSPSRSAPSALGSFVAHADDLGALRERPSISARDGGGSAEVGAKILWAFGDTFYSPERPATPTTLAADRYRSATGATSSLAEPLGLTTPMDDLGAPTQIIPHTDDEITYNRASNNPGDRIALWPVAPVSLGADAWIYYLRVHIQPKTKGPWTSTVGIARLRAGHTVAERSKEPLFGSNVPSFRSPLVQGSFVYLYDDCVNGCRIARAPIYSADMASTYQAWDGHAWTTDLSKAAVVIPASRTGITVMWSGFAEKYIGAYIPYGSTAMTFVTANAPAGPWSGPEVAFHGQPATSGGNYAPYFHAELTASASPEIYVTYSRDLGGFKGEVRLARVTVSPSWAAHPPDALRIMPLGDSVTDGLVFDPGAYRTELARKLTERGCVCTFVGSQSAGPPELRDLDSEGHLGATTGSLAQGASEWVGREQPDVILLMIGANDLGMPATSVGAADRVDQIVDVLFRLRPTATVVVASVPHGQTDMGTRAVAFNQALARQVVTRKRNGQRVEFVDAEHAVSAKNHGDGIHPSAAGYAQIGDAFANALASIVTHHARHAG